MASQPALPPGFVYEDELPPKPKRPTLSAKLPPIPEGFVLEPDGTAHDGDSFGLKGGGNARLLGADAFELDQTGRRLDGSTVPLGFLARSFLADRVSPDDKVTPTGKESYGRPVVMLDDGGEDVGGASIGAGLSIPVPEYLKADPALLKRYVDAQRDAIESERGAYAGTYQRPDEYRHQGADAPVRGKIAMTPQQAQQYSALVRNPKTTEAELSAWIEQQGHRATNVGNILQFVKRNPRATLSNYFQQEDALDQPVLPDGPGLGTRLLAAANEGIPDFLGAPVDLVNAGLGAVGLPTSDTPLLGSESIRSAAHYFGIGQTDERFAPRSDVERYGQAFARGVGQAVIPAGGTIAAGGRLALAAPTLARGGAVHQAVRGTLIDAARNPGVALAGEVGAGVGAGVAGQAARDAYPGNPWVEMGATVVGGLAGGVGAGVAASRARPPVRNAAVPARAPLAAVDDLPPIPDGFVLEEPAAPINPRVVRSGGAEGQLTRTGIVRQPGQGVRSSEPLPPLEPGQVRRGVTRGAAIMRTAGGRALTREPTRYVSGFRDGVGPAAAAAVPAVAGASAAQAGMADDWMGRMDAGRERYQRSIGDLWQMPEGELTALHGQALAAERAQLRAALDRAGVPETPRMGIDGESMEGAGQRVASAIEKHLGDIPEDIDRLISPRWEDHPEGGLPNADDIAEVLQGHHRAADVADNDPHWLASEVGWAMRDLKPGDLEAVGRGGGSITAQRAVLTMRNGYEALARRGVNSAEMPGLIRSAMVENGVAPATADELTHHLFEMLKPAAEQAARPRLGVRDAAMADETPIPTLTGPDPSSPFGPVHADLAGDFPAAVERLAADRAGEVPGALSHPDVGPIDLVWGDSKGGLQHIMEQHPEVVDHLPILIRGMEVESRSPNRIVMQGDNHRAIVRLDYDQQRKAWLLTAYERARKTPAPAEYRRVGAGDRDGSPDRGAGADIVDQTDAANLSPIPPGFVLEEPALGRARPAGERATPDEMAALARTVEPEDVQPIPGNAIESLDEAIRANPGLTRDLIAPDERGVLPPYRLGNGRTRRDPLDLIGWLRTKGGIREDRGELRAAGIDNRARQMEFANSEGFLGRLVGDDGMTIEDAAQAAFEGGWFPGRMSAPGRNEFLDMLEATHRGDAGRVFHPEDAATIDQYRAAQGQRYAIEQAAQEGSPLAEEVGDPVTLADLDANQPPATAYEDLPSVGGYAGNIRLDELNSPRDIRRALINTDAKVGGFDAARRGVVTHAETEALASELGMSADDLLKRRKGQALNAEEALAARQILAKSSDELVRIAGKAVGGSDADKAAFRQAWLRHVAIQEQVSGATAEAGRALQQFKMTAESKAAQGRIHKILIDEAGGNDKLEDVAQAIVDLQEAGTTPGGVTRFARDAMKPRLKDKLIELYYNALLSGPQTHVVNTLSNTMTAGLQLPEHAVAAGIGMARRAATLGRGGLDRVLLTEVGARTVGLMQGAKEGLAAFARTARTGVVPDHVTKVEAQVQEAISGLKGKVIRTPTRLLSAEDELFKAIGRRMEIAGLATRQARLEGLKGNELKTRIADLTANPTDEMVTRSMDYARYVTFQRPLGKFGTLLTSMTQEVPALKLIVPFVRTPTNILKFAAERSPAAPILKEVRADLVAGGARRDLAVARIGMGSGLGALAMQWAADGIITGGGPADKDARALMLADGWQPYSVRIGDRYYSYQRFDPLATTLGVAADFADVSSHMTEAQRERTALTVVTAIIKNLSNKVWLSGITDMSQAIADPDRYGTGFLSRMAGSIAVPAVVAQTARVVDPVVRDAREPIDRIRSRVPGMSSSLPAKRDVFGEVITSEGGLGPDMLSPMRTSTARNDPVVREMLAVEATVGKVPRKVKGRELTAGEYDAYQEMAGRMLRAQLEEEMLSPHWAGSTTEERKAAADKAKETSRKAARSVLGL